jgi:hypothetical protein
MRPWEMLPSCLRQISKLENVQRGTEIRQKVNVTYYFAPREHFSFSRLPIDRQTSGESNHPVLTNAPLFKPTPMGKPGPEAALFRVAACRIQCDRMIGANCLARTPDQANIDATADAE